MLEYHGKKMRVEPINAPLGALAALLREGEPVVAILEPGGHEQPRSDARRPW